MSRYKSYDFKKIKPISISDRKSNMQSDKMASPFIKNGSFGFFMDSLPDVLKARDFKTLVDRILSAREKNKPVLLMMGAHVIKVGLNPILISLMEKKIIQGIAMNGAGAIHDMELAYFQNTSEDVQSNLKDGTFGMARETAALLNETAQEGQKEKLGFGEVLGKKLVLEKPLGFSNSLLGQAYERMIPVTIHVALGTDIVHQHPSADGAAIGELSLRDFNIWTQLISEINRGGVVLLFGSSVILPEVFLKSSAVVQNVEGPVRDFTTAVFDMNMHYRPMMNVIDRPKKSGGDGFYFVGHHEIMIPLLAASILQKIK